MCSSSQRGPHEEVKPELPDMRELDLDDPILTIPTDLRPDHINPELEDDQRRDTWKEHVDIYGEEKDLRPRRAPKHKPNQPTVKVVYLKEGAMEKPPPL